jgi:subtilisin family serine protease
MRKLLALFALLVLVTLAPTAPVGNSQGLSLTKVQLPSLKYLSHGKKALPGKYIVVLEDWATGSPGEFSQADRVAEYAAGDYEGKVREVFQHTFNGFSAELTKENALKLSQDPRVKYIEEDAEATIDTAQASPPSWGLTRVGERSLDLTKPYNYPAAAGLGVDVYIVDTGIQDTQTDFGGRAKLVKSFVAGEANTDLNGHGTHVAGTIGSNTYGVAKKANLFGVKVLNGQGSGQYSDVIAGINYVAQRVRSGKTVLSMSLGGPKSQAVDDAVNAAVKAGVVVIVAAGNNAGDACSLSPSGAANAYAVGASDNTDKVASFSNFGKCVRMIAPGVNITSLWKGANGATNTISGTSMATPHVSGVAALLMSQKQYVAPGDVYNALNNLATVNAIKGLNAQTPNRLVYNGSGF